MNRNTGSAAYSKTLVDLRGVVASINFKLDVSYASGQSKGFGLPRTGLSAHRFSFQGKVSPRSKGLTPSTPTVSFDSCCLI